MFAREMLALGKNGSTIREIFEYGKGRAAEIGEENIFDFSIGNPNVPAPDCVKEGIMELLNGGDQARLHSYTSAQGDAGVRSAIARHINALHGTALTGDNLYMTCGAAASLAITIKALAVRGDEFVLIAPFFPEYSVFVRSAEGKPVIVPARGSDFQIEIEKLADAIVARTKAVIINSPNNPSGAVYSEATLEELASLLERKSKEFGHVIYLIADEPYREIVYDKDVTVPYPMKYYADTFICYSYSKSLSLPGERIGYVAVSERMKDIKEAYAAVCGAGRALGFVCAPSLMQFLIAKCIGKTADISLYKKNRNILCEALRKYGYEFVPPDGAFYLFVKSLEPDATAFCKRAREHELLLVPGDDFFYPGYVRISYCVKTCQIERALPAFEKLAKRYII